MGATADLFPALAPRFRCISIDAPWPEHGGGQVQRGADRHYPLLDKPGARTVPEILRVVRESPLWRPFPDAAHVWSWVTDNYLPAGLWLLEQLGARFVRTFPWVKTGKLSAADLETLAEQDLRAGIGQYGRGAHELLLFGVIGDGMSPAVYTGRRDIPSVIVAPHERNGDGKVVHSRKPEKSYELIEARSRGAYAEIFARRGRPGWESWGNEIDPELRAGAVG